MKNVKLSPSYLFFSSVSTSLLQLRFSYFTLYSNTPFLLQYRVILVRFHYSLFVDFTHLVHLPPCVSFTLQTNSDPYLPLLFVQVCTFLNENDKGDDSNEKEVYSSIKQGNKGSRDRRVYGVKKISGINLWNSIYSRVVMVGMVVTW